MGDAKQKNPIINLVNDDKFESLLLSYSLLDNNQLMERIEKKQEIKNYIIDGYKKIQLANRFFLEEMVHRIKNDNTEYYETLTKDWLAEFVDLFPLTEKEREDYIKNVLGWDEEFCESAYFKSEKDLINHIK